MIIIDTNKKVPIYEQIYREIRADILQGKLKKNDKLKPIRILAKELNVSHNTVNKAYQQLLSEGYISGRQGSGYYVDELFALTGIRSFAGNEEEVRQVAEGTIKWDFHYDRFDNSAFPWSKWRRAVHNAITEESYVDAIGYEINKGSFELRKSICEYVNKYRGVRCDVDQIVIIPGTHFGMEIVANILPQNQYNIAMEEPGFDGMREVFTNVGWEITPIDVLDNGIDANALERTDCNILYLTPSHQFPMGVTLSLSKRLQILEWGRRNNAYIIENDYDNEFLFGKRPVLSIQSMDQNGKVIYLSTFAKILTPEIRCAYLILPKELMEVYEKKYQTYYSVMSNYEQRALNDFIKEGYLESQARKMSVINDKKSRIFRQVIDRELHGDVEFPADTAGTHYMVRLKGFTDQKELIRRLEDYGIRIYDTKKYWYDQKRAVSDMYLMGYSSISEENLEKACVEFADALKEIKYRKQIK